MSLFKYKPPKKIILDERNLTTLDSKHKELQTEFQNIEDTIIPTLEEEKKSLKQRLEKLRKDISEDAGVGVDNGDNGANIPKSEKSVIEERLEIRDRIKEINDSIKKYKQNYKNYYLHNSEYIFEYFENKKTITTGGGSTKTKSLNAFFNLPEAKKTEELFKIQHNTVEKYLANIDQNYMDISKYVYPIDICQFCRQGEMIPVESEGIMVCNQCAKHVVFLIDNEKPSYKEPPKEACFYAYKRINHFREILAQFQAKETTSIPDHVLESIKQQIKKERIEITQFTDKKAKEIMKKLGFNKYYEHIPFIKDKLGIKPPVMTPDLEDRLCNLFMEIQGPYAKFCPDDRVNFLNYYYTVYKLCELLGRREFLPFFPMLKDREKRIEQDQIWKQICIELDWEFIATP